MKSIEEKDLENLRQKLKIFNYRPLVLIFLGLIFGILVKNFIIRKTIITVVGIIIVVGVLLFYSILHKKFKYFVIMGITFILGFGVYGLYVNGNTHTAPNMCEQSAVGTVAGITTYNNCLGLLLENVKVEDSKLDYNIKLYYMNTRQDGYIKLSIGSKISFNIDKQEAPDQYNEEGLPHTYNIKNNVGAEFTTYEVVILDDNKSIKTSLLDSIRDNLRFGLNNQNGNMIYSAMFGDKSELSRDLYNAYKTSGVAHLLAVSGLHVGLVVAILNWIMKKCRIKGWWRVGVIGILLMGYAYLCGFSYSIIRASIMAMVLMIAPLLFSEYDLLSSICFAGSLILLIEPIAIFDLSALLSFGCVLGIAMLYPIFKRWLYKVPIKDGIKDAFSISLSTIISTFAVMTYFFGYIQPIGLISNIIIIPIFSVLFMLTFVVTILSLILPFISYTLILINPLFEWLNWFIIFIANHTKSILIPNINFLSVLLSFMLIAFASKFNLRKGLDKITLVSICSFVLVLQVALI